MDAVIRADVMQNTLSPLGWHLVGRSNIEAAEHLVTAGVRLRFQDPVRALYAHGWELNLKACLRRQGLTAEEIRKQFGHDLLKLWDAVDRSRFSKLQLHDKMRSFVEHVGFYHRNRLYAYPVSGPRLEHTLTYVRAAAGRFLLSRPDALTTFGSP